MLLLRSGGELAVLVFDVTGSDAQCWLQLGRARGRLELAMSDGTTTKVVRCDLGQDVGSALARSTHRRMAEPTDFAVAIRSLIAWLGTPDSLAVLGFDPRAGSSPVVVNLYAEPWVAQRRTAVRESQEP
ncbi:MAG: hypothetical protein HXY24_02605 [Rubrivivax sp.]|nr:hypothetical protein [Rubrivivax sp.]